MTGADSFDALLAARSSCRAFLPDPVDRSIIEAILASAQKTASWCNSQPWQLFITTGAATDRFRAAYAAAAERSEPAPDFEFPSEYSGVYGQRRRECGRLLYESLGIERGDRARAQEAARDNYRFFGAPHVAIVTSPADLGLYGAIDCGAYVHNFMLAAKSRGVASIAQAALARHPEVIRRHFGMAPDRRVVCGISFGYADPAHPANAFCTPRAAIAEAAHFFEV
ncbi:nitroreductase [Sphingopyxis granuli]|uniref:nitroreductase n=1 Tax=Sphingopyxis granuli TaxID=267128 RepID=UPI00083765F6|nr:nitroreductase [Sphingopyxis granuli]